MMPDMTKAGQIGYYCFTVTANAVEKPEGFNLLEWAISWQRNPLGLRGWV